MGFEGKTFLIAGVGTGLGTAVACVLAAEGANVVAVARSNKALDPVVAAAKTRHWSLTGRTGDVFVQSDIDAIVARTVKEHGSIDGVSVHVGHWIMGEGLLHKMTDEQWSAGIRDNLEPIYRLGRAVLPHLIERGRGSLVAVAAAPAIRWAGVPSYHAAKGGLVDLIPRLARDYRAFGVRVNAVLPGSMRGAVTDYDPPAAGGAIPLADETATSPWEVARAIRYFLSDESRWVTGSTLIVDGGLSTGTAERPA
ncbi:MAG TPA: SDR family oxidoreductase [Thermoplasmata archaeon]|nr:SDR family oxidoreductase [Thermoplasmata archaeon]